MPNFDGSGALGYIGQNPIPQGTPDELRKQGVDPGKVASCAPQSPGVRGCPVWDDCPFHQQRYGGFKGKGPRNVGYYIRTHEGKQQQNFVTCHNFTRSLLARMRAGNVAREEGKAHEILRIIAQEGETIRHRTGLAVNPDNHNINAPWEMRTLTVVVPAHPRPGDNTQLDYEGELWQEELIRRKYDPEFQTGLPAEAAAINEIEEPFNADEEVLEFGATAAKGEAPAKGAKGK